MPEFLSIRATARRGPLSEYTLRQLARQGKLPCIYSGKKALINYEKLIEQLNMLGEEGCNGCK